MVLESMRQAASYAAAARRILPRGGRSVGARLAGAEERLVFVVGAPRSGTTFLGNTLGAQPGFVDLGEVVPLKTLLPTLSSLPEAEQARRIRRVLERTRKLALVPGLRAVEQTPELAFLLRAALAAYPRAQAVHIVRDGRDVVCSLLERGWLKAERSGHDHAGQAYGAGTRFWVEPERAHEFSQASDATRAAWAWRRYVRGARSVGGGRLTELRYELMADDPRAAAELLAGALEVPPEPLAEGLAGAHARSVGRYRTDLTATQLDEVDREAGPLLHELGYSG